MTDKNEETKPCPFCGGMVEIVQIGDRRIDFICTKCHTQRRQRVLQAASVDWLAEEVKKFWNNRPTEAALHTRIAELVEQNDRFLKWHNEQGAIITGLRHELAEEKEVKFKLRAKVAELEGPNETIWEENNVGNWECEYCIYVETRGKDDYKFCPGCGREIKQFNYWPLLSTPKEPR